MPRITKEQAICLAATQDVWKVNVFESERGWGSESWDAYFDNYQDSVEYQEKLNKDNPTDHVPDYYTIAYTPEKVKLTLS